MISGGGGTAGSLGSVTEGEKGLRSETWNDGWIRSHAGSWRLKVMQILGGEPDLISKTIDKGGRPAGICKGLVSPHCLLELDMS